MEGRQVVREVDAEGCPSAPEAASTKFELTRALKNLEHPGRARGIGVVPWKVAWAEDSSYKTHRKSKAEQEEKFRASSLWSTWVALRVHFYDDLSSLYFLGWPASPF